MTSGKKGKRNDVMGIDELVDRYGDSLNFGIERVVIDDVPPFPHLDIVFKNRCNLIIGGYGTGKTALFNCIRSSVSNDIRKNLRPMRGKNIGHIKLETFHREEKFIKIGKKTRKPVSKKRTMCILLDNPPVDNALLHYLFRLGIQVIVLTAPGELDNAPGFDIIRLRP
jgi:hypothetical protein